MFTRYLSSNRKILTVSILAGFFIALLLGTLQFFWSYHKREVRFDTLITDLSVYMASYFEELKTSIDTLQPLTLNNCHDVSAELTSRAAFSINVRAFLLVRDKKAFCSSATGPMDVPLEELIPELHINKPLDMVLLPGTPMLPNKPAIAIWYRNPLVKDGGVFTSVNINLTPYLLYTARQDEFAGIAVIIGDQALSTMSGSLLKANDLHEPPSRTATLKDFPLTINLYAEQWTTDELLFALFFGLVCGIAAGSLSYYILTIRLNPGKEILTAIKRGQFYVVYQPVVDAKELKMRGVEVLMRWKHPTMGEIPPDAFINFAEAQKLIVPLTLHLFDLIIQDAPVLQTVLPPGAKLGINIAPGHLHADSFKEDMRAFNAALPPDHFQTVLEITERDMIQQREANQLFEWLHNEGFEIAIDDFGTGHSALIYLERFTMDYLKIDRGFVNAIGTETVTSPVLDAVLTLARRLNMSTVAEGVETPEQAAWLREHGVNFLQGYWISRPMPLAQFRKWQPDMHPDRE
ncbi:TPA: cyclic di-GMP phosphodiesterase [Enterobacter soli]|uniref:cyclic di-GMP phosphodiesterase n=1 Tax=Enterobacter sp. CP102 TaxID=2976431 RepID=UPI0021FFEFD6|nr:cyclic di-GMP phosphodiesterase [Enterobacter sp. CP102]UWM62848.1 cyclic di-GMP phosphodiesterase [Enterobacter sp. CP102]HDX4048409.1 cyclic di-GMP phosphodiesterase [Enterobacter soli]